MRKILPAVLLVCAVSLSAWAGPGDSAGTEPTPTPTPDETGTLGSSQTATGDPSGLVSAFVDGVLVVIFNLP